MPRRTTRRRIGVPDAFRRLPMDEEDLRGLPSFRVIRVSTEAQDYRGGPEGQAHELDLAEHRTGVLPTGLELRDASPGWDAGRLEPALAWAAEGRVKVGLVPYFSRFMRDPALAFAYRDAFHARGCVLYFADRRLLSADPARQGDFGELAVKAQIDNLDRARAIAGGMAAKFRSHRDPGGHPGFGFRRTSGPRPVLEPDPDHIGEARALFELYATGGYSDDTLALEAGRRGYRSPRTGRPLAAAGIAELLRNPVYNGYLIRYRGFADEERVEAPWRRRQDGDARAVDPPVSDDLWERVQAIRAERSTPGVKSVKERVYPPRLACHGCGTMLTGQAPNGRRRMVHPAPVCAMWKEAAGTRQSFRAEVYEWQIAALLATATLDEAVKRRVAASLLGSAAPLDTRRIGRLEQELRTLALDNAFGRVGDDDYLRRKAALTTDLEEARRPATGSGLVDPARAIAWIDDLRLLWEVELPERAEHAATRREYEVRRAEATGTAFERLEVLGPVIVEAKVAEDLLAGRALIEAIAPERAVLLGDKAEVMAQLVDGKQPWIRRADSPTARRKREWRAGERTKESIGRGERICTGRSHAADRAARGDLDTPTRGRVRSQSGVSWAVRRDGRP
ncbi:MAG TPA: recombinase family protein, partial [Propionicimonas sp.]